MQSCWTEAHWIKATALQLELKWWPWQNTMFSISQEWKLQMPILNVSESKYNASLVSTVTSNCCHLLLLNFFISSMLMIFNFWQVKLQLIIMGPTIHLPW